MKITIASCFHKRPQIAEAFCIQIQRLQQTHSIQAVIAVSEEESARICIKHNIPFVCAFNNPVGNKWNAAVEAAMKTDCEYVLILGDDDFISSQLLDLYIPYMEKGISYFGVDSITFCDTATRSASIFRYDRSRLVGAGRCIAKWVLDKYGYHYPIEYSKNVDTRELYCNEGDIVYLPKELALYQNGVGYGILCGEEKFMLFDSIDRGLDNSCEMHLCNHGIIPLQIKTATPLIVDIKSGSNMWDYTHIMNSPNIEGYTDFNTALSFLSDGEKQIIYTLQTA